MLAAYFSGNVQEYDRSRMVIYKAMCDLLWTLWGLIQLANEKSSRRIVSVENTGRVSEYELLHSVDMQIAKGLDGNPPVLDPEQRPNTISVIREYTYDRTGVLGKADEANILRSEMREELVNHLMLRLLANVRQTQ